jgi:tetratricopeptide (TPR) repeat protein
MFRVWLYQTPQFFRVLRVSLVATSPQIPAMFIFVILSYFDRILAIRIDTLGENHINVAMVYRNLGTLEYSNNKIDLALDYYEKSLKIFEVCSIIYTY